jgi:tetratricopeptide (TPR) repeat protein
MHQCKRHPLTEQRTLFREVKPRSNPYRILVWIGLILGAVALLLQLRRGEIKPLFMPTPTPTRTSLSYTMEAQAYFAAGKLDDPATDQDALGTYELATQVDPTNAQLWAELARIQAYSYAMLSTDNDRLTRLQQALASADRAVELDPEDSMVRAIRAFVLDWNASSNLITQGQRDAYLNQAESEAVRALQLDPNNVLALAFYAEVLVDQQKWSQAQQFAEQAVTRAPDSMDVHRVYATVLENVAEYRTSIEQYLAAAEITPNFTYLYLRVGYGYRNLGLREPTTVGQEQQYTIALEYFERAANINEQLGVRDPQPYIAIAKTYTQMGQAFVASRNAEKALEFDPTNSDTYGQLGMIYVQSKNYESALIALQCAVEGCTAEENTIALDLVDQGLLTESVAVKPLPLTNTTVGYYYIRYGSVLAYLRQEGDGSCEKSMTLMAKLREAFPNDVDLLSNIQTNEELCISLTGTPVP